MPELKAQRLLKGAKGRKLMRLGNRGIVTLSDGRAIDLSIGDLLRRDGKRKLHPIQFYELREGLLQGDAAEPHPEIHHGGGEEVG